MRLDQIRRGIGRVPKQESVDAADWVMYLLIHATDNHGYDFIIPQSLTGSEWCIHTLRSKNVHLDKLKTLCWEVIEDAAIGRVAQNAQTNLSFGLEWDGIADI